MDRDASKLGGKGKEEYVKREHDEGGAQACRDGEGGRKGTGGGKSEDVLDVLK